MRGQIPALIFFGLDNETGFRFSVEPQLYIEHKLCRNSCFSLVIFAY